MSVELTHSYDGRSYESGHVCVRSDDRHADRDTFVERGAADCRDPASCDDPSGFTRDPDGHEIEILDRDPEQDGLIRRPPGSDRGAIRSATRVTTGSVPARLQARSDSVAGSSQPRSAGATETGATGSFGARSVSTTSSRGPSRRRRRGRSVGRTAGGDATATSTLLA